MKDVRHAVAFAVVLGGLGGFSTACGNAKKPTAAAPVPAPVPLTSRYLCRRLNLVRLRAITGDPWHRAVPAKRPDIACDVSVSATQAGEVHVMVDDERRPGVDQSEGQLLATLWFQQQTRFSGFHTLPGTSGNAAFNAGDGVLVVTDGAIGYSVQVLSQSHTGRSVLPLARRVLALVRP